SKGTANVVKFFRDTVRSLGMWEDSHSQESLSEWAVLGLNSRLKSDVYSYGQFGARISKLARAAIVEAQAISHAEHTRIGGGDNLTRQAQVLLGQRPDYGRFVPQDVIDRTILGNLLIAGMIRDCLVEDKVDGGRFVSINRPRLG